MASNYVLKKADKEDLDGKADVSQMNKKVDYKQMQIAIQSTISPLEEAFSNFMDLMKKQMSNLITQNVLDEVIYFSSLIFAFKFWWNLYYEIHTWILPMTVPGRESSGTENSNILSQTEKSYFYYDYDIFSRFTFEKQFKWYLKIFFLEIYSSIINFFSN